MSDFLDERCGKVDPPDLYGPDIPECCWNCSEPLDSELDENGCCPACGERLEP